MMKLEEIAESAYALSNQMRAGATNNQILETLAQMQPNYDEFWSKAKQSVSSGERFSSILAEVWPESLVSAVYAGEASGKIEDALDRIEESVQLQIKIRESVGKLKYPASMILFGLTACLALTFLVLPKVNSIFEKPGVVQETSPIIAIFNAAQDNIVGILLLVVFGGIALWNWIKTPEAKETLMDLALSIPPVRRALKDLFFGLWSYYVAMMSGAGLGVLESIKLSESALPMAMRESTRAFYDDMAGNKSMADAVNLKKLDDNDPRVIWWPLYISSAFLQAHQTGDIEAALNRVAPSLVNYGFKRLDSTITKLNNIALAIAVSLIMLPYAMLYGTIFEGIQHSF